jgi:hypothetical protein
MTLLGIRTKAGFEIRCYRVNDCAFYSHKGELLHVSNEPVFTDHGFYAAWSKASGFSPFCTIRKFRGKFRKWSETFIPQGANVERIKTFARGGSSVKFSPLPAMFEVRP